MTTTKASNTLTIRRDQSGLSGTVGGRTFKVIVESESREALNTKEAITKAMEIAMELGATTRICNALNSPQIDPIDRKGRVIDVTKIGSEDLEKVAGFRATFQFIEY